MSDNQFMLTVKGPPAAAGNTSEHLFGLATASPPPPDSSLDIYQCGIQTSTLNNLQDLSPCPPSFVFTPMPASRHVQGSSPDSVRDRRSSRRSTHGCDIG
ncbi:hypothetical protein E2C01_047303 [Portunus trituberculatus]|uniref:Uncharacterized protein n=1 Tax=Portunus trituberculatus TaxID=210409 RepID=A0A5B7G866_PORTR|nr:hypothetical protein [Portunus trituberculatus]